MIDLSRILLAATLLCGAPLPLRSADVAPSSEVEAVVADSTGTPEADSVEMLPATLPLDAASGSPCIESVAGEDRLWLISTRHLCPGACRAQLDSPDLRVFRLNRCGGLIPSSVDEYLELRDASRPTVIYVHGNRMERPDAIQRGLFVYRQVAGRYAGQADWVIWSWPSQREGLLLNDVRVKAQRTDTQGLYLAWLLREHAGRQQRTAMVGYSFGARIISGALHALAGGSLGGRALPGPTILGANFEVGMIAPALENDWMSEYGYHRLATQNLDRLTVLYNRRDAVLKNYWRIRGIRNADALGYTGPTSFAPRYDGTRLPVRARDCGPVVGFHHSEVDYYNKRCGAGREMASIVKGSLIPNE